MPIGVSASELSLAARPAGTPWCAGSTRKCATLSLERRLALLAWACEDGRGLILENDYDSEFRECPCALADPVRLPGPG